MTYGHGAQNKELTPENLAEAEKDYQLLNNPGYGGFNFCYNDNYFGAAMERKWKDWGTLGKRIKAMKAKAKLKSESLAGAGI